MFNISLIMEVVLRPGCSGDCLRTTSRLLLEAFGVATSRVFRKKAIG